MGLIGAPTTVGIASTAMQDDGLCDTVKVSGLAAERDGVMLNGCAPQFAPGRS